MSRIGECAEPRRGGSGMFRIILSHEGFLWEKICCAHCGWYRKENSDEVRWIEE